MQKRKSLRKHARKSMKRRSRTNRKLRGGEPCNVNKDVASCRLNMPRCLWSVIRGCHENPALVNDTQRQPQPQIVKPTTLLQPQKPQIVKPTTPSPPFSTKHLQPPRVLIMPVKPPSRNSLENLPLVDPILAFSDNWPTLTDVVNVPGDGNCLFHALRAGLRSLGLYDGTTPELRTRIVSQLRDLLKNGDDLSAVFGSSSMGESAQNRLTFGEYFESQHATDIRKTPLSQQVKAYLDGMLKNAWGTEIEVWMTSRIFNVNIDIFTLPRGNSKLTQLNRGEDTSRPTIRLYNASGASAYGIHYQVIPASISIDAYTQSRQ